MLDIFCLKYKKACFKHLHFRCSTVWKHLYSASYSKHGGGAAGVVDPSPEPLSVILRGTIAGLKVHTCLHQRLLQGPQAVVEST